MDPDPLENIEDNDVLPRPPGVNASCMKRTVIKMDGIETISIKGNSETISNRVVYPPERQPERVRAHNQQRVRAPSHYRASKWLMQRVQISCERTRLLDKRAHPSPNRPS